jgi:hypothetical protein
MRSPNEDKRDKMGPLKDDHPLLNETCPVCGQKFKIGQYVTMVALASEHVPVHWGCVTKERSGEREE